MLGQKLAKDIYSENDNEGITTFECLGDTLYIKQIIVTDLSDKNSGLVKDRIDYYLPFQDIARIQKGMFSSGSFNILSEPNQGSFTRKSFSSNTLKHVGTDQTGRVVVHLNAHGAKPVNEQKDIDRLKLLIQELNPKILLE